MGLPRSIISTDRRSRPKESDTSTGRSGFKFIGMLDDVVHRFDHGQLHLGGGFVRTGRRQAGGPDGRSQEPDIFDAAAYAQSDGATGVGGSLVHFPGGQPFKEATASRGSLKNREDFIQLGQLEQGNDIPHDIADHHPAAVKGQGLQSRYQGRSGHWNRRIRPGPDRGPRGDGPD